MKAANTPAATYGILHIFLLIYAVAAVFSKTAAMQSPPSVPFLFYYGSAIALLMIYAAGWQLILKRLPLGIAFSNRAVTIIWYIAAGMILFGEQLHPSTIAGAILIIAGILVLSRHDS